MRLFHKLLIILLPLALFYFLLLWSSIYLTTSNYVEKKLRNDLEAVATLHQKALNTWVLNTKERLQSFNSRLLVRKILANNPDGELAPKEHQQLTQIVLKTKQMVSSFDELFLVSVNGRIITSTIPNQTGQLLTRFEQVRQKNEKIIIAQEIPKSQGLRLLHAIKLELDGKHVGYLVVKTKAESLVDLLNAQTGLGKSGKLTILAPGRNNQFIPLLQGPLESPTALRLSSTKLLFTDQFELETSDARTLFAITKDIQMMDWKLLITIPEVEVFEVVRNIQFFGIVGALFAAILMLLSLVYIAKSLCKPIEGLVNHANELQLNTNDSSFELSGIKEYDKLAKSLNAMTEELLHQKHNLEENVESRTKDIQEKNAKLKNAVSELKQTQNLLIETEKMAALGEMVAGIAHEVNTPIGSALGAASHLADMTKSVSSKYQQGSLTEDDFEHLLSSNQMSADILVANLQRAAELIRSFKRVAVDQSNEKILDFELIEYIQDVILSLKPRYKHMRLDFNLTGLPSVKVSQIPGVIAQIISNLIVNSIVHGFEHRAHGLLTIDVTNADDQSLKICLSDNGKGIPAEIKDKLFDPFFTTKRNKGGTGLGLNIVYNLVSKNLKGTISVSSELGNGALFTMVIPRYHQVLLV